jgi:ubiquinone/menaquinone biosynthesis C-methylase UbiE
MPPKTPEYPSKLYDQFRPNYPPELYDIIYQFHKQNPNAEYKFAVDVATGTGKTAIELSKKFEKVVGLDIAPNMLNDAVKGNNIEYEVANAEEFSSKFINNSVDLITVSTAAHWFNMDLFYKECVNALKPSGTLAIWAYGHFVMPDYPELTLLHMEYATIKMGPYWDKGRDMLDNLYSYPEFVMSPFPVFSRSVYPDGESNPIIMRKRWSLSSIKGYLLTWSCYKNYKQQIQNEQDPIDEFIEKCKKIIGVNSMDFEIDLYWPIVLILCKFK